MKQLHTLTLKELQAKAKELGLKGVSSLRKQELLEHLEALQTKDKKVKQDKQDKQDKTTSSKREQKKATGVKNRRKEEKAPQSKKTLQSPEPEKKKDTELQEKALKLGVQHPQEMSSSQLVRAIEEKLREKNAHKEVVAGEKDAAKQEKQETPLKREVKKEEAKQEDKKQEEKKNDSVDEVHGFLELIENKDFGFLRFDNFSPGEDDVYVSPVFIRKFNLRTGDKIHGKAKKNNDNDRYRALIYINLINDLTADRAIHRQGFSQLTPIHPIERMVLTSNRIELSTRLIDLISPVGRGQRGLIVAPPKAGKTILLQNIARSIEKNYPEVEVIVLLIDERPEEVTEMQRSIHSDVVYSTFDEMPSNHIRVAELVRERAMALAEMGKDVVILLDSITRLARAYNLETSPSGRTLSGGIDPAALHLPKKFFGTARKLEEGGSVTILATALIETGSRMDDVIYEEFKGTGNMELVLTRNLAEKRIFPAIDIEKSGTRREELLLDQKELEFAWNLRRNMDRRDQISLLEDIINLMLPTKDNQEFMYRWKQLY